MVVDFFFSGSGDKAANFIPKGPVGREAEFLAAMTNARDINVAAAQSYGAKEDVFGVSEFDDGELQLH